MTEATAVDYKVTFSKVHGEIDIRTATFKAFEVGFDDGGIQLRSVTGEVVLAVSAGNWISVERI